MEYKVHFTLSIRSLNKGKIAFGYKELFLPFVPFVGLRLGEKLGSSQPVESITWSDEEKKFHCHINDQEAEMDDGSMLDMDFLIRNAKRNGWLGFDGIFEDNS